MMRRLLAAISILAAIAFAGEGHAAPEGSRFNANYFTNLPVVTQDGATVRFYEDLIKGKRVVFNFAYLNCNDICPLAVSRVAEVQRRLGDAVGREVFFYTITLDPAHDTPELLKLYAEAFGAGPGWQFLTGKPEDIELIRFKLGEQARKLSEHRNDLILGNDADGDWSRSSTFADIEDIVTTIRELDPVYRDQVHTTKTDAATARQLRLGNVPGQALFLKTCSTCHTIGQGKLIGPDLKGVTERRDRAWLTRYLMSPGRMRAEKDPLVTELRAQFPGVRMPDLGLLGDDVGDLLHYIEAQSRKDADAAASGGEPGGSTDRPPAAAPKG